MKRGVVRTAIAIGLLTIGFITGSYYQEAKTGYRFRVVEAKEYPSPMGAVRWIHATESICATVIEADTTMIVLDGRTIYKAERDFQESSPFAKDVQLNGNVIEWDDGISKFHLTVSDKN